MAPCGTRDDLGMDANLPRQTIACTKAIVQDADGNIPAVQAEVHVHTHARAQTISAAAL